MKYFHVNTHKIKANYTRHKNAKIMQYIKW